MEYFSFGDLSRYVESPLLEKEIKQIIRNILVDLNVMHQESFVHRDLKPQVCNKSVTDLIGY